MNEDACTYRHDFQLLPDVVKRDGGVQFPADLVERDAQGLLVAGEGQRAGVEVHVDAHAVAGRESLAVAFHVLAVVVQGLGVYGVWGQEVSGGDETLAINDNKEESPVPR